MEKEEILEKYKDLQIYKENHGMMEFDEFLQDLINFVLENSAVIGGEPEA